MDTDKNTATPTPPAETGELRTAVETVTTEWKSWIVTACVAAAAVLIVILYRAHQTGNIETASRMLGEARNVEALQAIVTQYGSTPAAQLAMLSIGKAQFDAGDYAAATTTYGNFLARYPKHPMAPVAELGRIHCMEAMGQTAEALSAYTTFATHQASSYLAPLAVFGKARCLEQMGRPEEAKTVYEDFLAAHPNSEWNSDVEDFLKHLDRTLRKPSVKL